MFFEEGLGLAGDVVVESSGDFGEELEDGDFRTETGPNGAEFEANRPGSDDEEGFGDFVEGDTVVGVDDLFAVVFEEREFDDLGTRRDQDVLGCMDGGFFALGDFDLAVTFKAADAVKAINVVLFD